MKIIQKINFPIKAFILIIILFAGSGKVFGQDSTKSLAFKRNRPDDRVYFYSHPDLSYELWQHFSLLKEANAGNALAQHELGIRYILGEGVPADTVKAAYWINKAAEQKLPGACYNYGILLNNGWGVEWNPFDAYNFFLIAANDNMPQAEYIIGISYTDNLIVKRNWTEAYRWLRKSADAGFKPAIETLTELKKSVSFSKIDTTETNREDGHENDVKYDSRNNQSSIGSSNNLVFIDFNLKQDTNSVVSNKILIEDLLHEGNDTLVKALHLTEKKDTSFAFNNASINLITKSGESGSPEALTILGKLFELGVYVPKDLTQAAVYYVRALRLDSPRSPSLLWNLIKDKKYFNQLKRQIDQNDPRAMYVWYGLFASGIDEQLTEADALNLLKKSASLNFIPAINELGLNYYTGKFIKLDREKAIAVWQHAKNLGSNEAALRIAVAEIYGYIKTNDDISAIGKIQKAEEEGSILAQAMLAYCYENGIGLQTNEAQAAKYYRFAAQRGSHFAFDELKQMYDALRPNNNMFNIN